MNAKIYENPEYLEILCQLEKIEKVRKSMENIGLESDFDIQVRLPNDFNEAILYLIRKNNEYDYQINFLKIQFLAVKDKKDRSNYRRLLEKIIYLLKIGVNQEIDFAYPEELREFYLQVEDIISKQNANNMLLSDIKEYQKEYDLLIAKKMEIEKKYKITPFSLIRRLTNNPKVGN